MAGHQRYRLLDELRVVAAVAVLVFHIGTRGGGPLLLPNGFLAVDFFFMLSGFVIAEAYEARLQAGLTFTGFAARRLVRMAPVAVLGAAIGGAYLVARAFAAPARSDPLIEVVGANLLNLMILPKLWHGRATGWELFPANGPLWSLFFEIAINLIWAAFLAGRSSRVLCLVVSISAGFLVALGLHFGSLDIGWEAISLAGGAARVGFGFGTGLLLHRMRAGIPAMGRPSAIMALTALVYFLALPLPLLGWRLLIVLVCMPAVLLVAVAAGKEQVLPGGTLLGRLSYPLYGIHVPLLALTAGALKYVGGGAGGHWTALLLAPLLLVAAWAVLVLIDEPARRWLARRIPASADSSGGTPQPQTARRVRRTAAARHSARGQLLRN